MSVRIDPHVTIYKYEKDTSILSRSFLGREGCKIKLSRDAGFGLHCIAFAFALQYLPQGRGHKIPSSRNRGVGSYV